mmetsp:Transcript_29454/g.59752  ORF Transcript_29454/g.59752 Transcript_29454/m.59752 type:complete len:170 (+) Transcript_29454:271-780(+)
MPVHAVTFWRAASDFGAVATMACATAQYIVQLSSSVVCAESSNEYATCSLLTHLRYLTPQTTILFVLFPLFLHQRTAPQSKMAATRSNGGPLFLSDEPNSSTGPPPTERGVSVDQDGKSNVWAIEPKMEVDTKSSEEKTTSALLAVGGLAAFAAVAAGVLTNLPDPDQF